MRQGGDAQGDQDDGDIAGDHGEGADETELFGDCGEDEVGVFLGQEFKLALAAEAIALAQQTARAEGDLGLHDVIARARRIAFRIEEGQHAVALIAVHAEHDIEGHGDRRRYRHAGDDLPAQSRHEHHGRAGQADQHGGAQVGLVRYQDEGKADHTGRDQQLPVEAGLLGRRAVVPAGQTQHEADLHQFGRLDARDADIEPARRAHGRITQPGHFDQRQHQQGQAVDGIGQPEPPFQMDHRQQEHDHQKDAEADQVLGGPGLPAALGHRIEHQGTDTGDHTQKAGEPPVDLGQLDRQALAFAGTSQGRSGHCGAPGK